MVDFARLVLDADTKGLKKAERDLGGLADTAESTASRVGTRMRSLGVGLTAGVSAPLAFVGKGMFDAAVRAEEMNSRFDVVFGDMSDSVRSWAETTGNALSRSTQEIQGSAVAFQELFGSALDPQQAADLSKEFAVLTQDLASFKDLSNEVAQQKLFSGLTGEAEPLKAIGVFINDTAVKAKALELGLGGVSGALTDQEKIIARAALIREQLAAADGDVLRTSDSAANQIKASQAAYEELSVTIGNELIPAITPLITGIANILTAMNNVSPALTTFAVGAGLVAVALGPILLGIGTLIPLFTTIAGVIATVGGAAATAASFIGTAGLGAALSVVGAFLAPLLPVLAAVAAAVGAVYLAWKYWDEIVAFVEGVGAAIIGWYEESVKPAFEGAMAIIEPFVTFFSDYFGAQIEDTIAMVSALLEGDFSGAWEFAKQIGTRAIQALITIVSTIGGAAYNAFEYMRKKVIEVLVGLGSSLITMGRDLIMGLVTGIKNSASAVWNAIKDVVMGGIDWAKDLLGIASPSKVFAEIGEFVSEGLAQGITKGKSSVEAAARDMVRSAISILDRLYPEIARGRKLMEELATLDAAGLSDSALQDARLRLVSEGNEPALSSWITNGVEPIQNAANDIGGTIEELGDKSETQAVRIQESFKDMAEGVLGSLRNLTQSIKGGDFLDILGGVLDLFLQIGSTGAFGQGLANNINSAPTNRSMGGMAYAGQSYIVGERGPERFTPPGTGRIHSNDNMDAGNMNISVEASPFFDVRVDGRIVTAAPLIADAGARQAGAQAARSGRRRVR